MGLGLFFGGLSFFLMGLKQVGGSLRGAASKQLQEWLAFLSSSPPVGFVTGLVVTSLSNSLTLVSVLLVQFVSAGMLPFERCLPVLMGAGVGSTLIGLLVVLNVTKCGLIMIAMAFLVEQFGLVHEPTTSESVGAGSAWKFHALRVLGGLGLVFYGSELMGHAFEFLHDGPNSNPSLVESLKAWLEYPILGLAVGTLFCTLMQSSGASLGVFLGLAQQGVLTAHIGIGLVLGANIGTCVTAVLAAFGQGVGPMRVAAALIVARLGGGIVCCLCVDILQHASEFACGLDFGASADSPGTNPADHASVIAAAHTVFNIALAVIVLPLAKPYSRFIVWAVRDRHEKETLTDV